MHVHTGRRSFGLPCSRIAHDNGWICRTSIDDSLRASVRDSFSSLADCSRSHLLLLPSGLILLPSAFNCATQLLPACVLHHCIISTENSKKKCSLCCCWRASNAVLKDVDGVDNIIPRSFMSFVRTLVASAEILIVIAWATPIFVIVFVVLFVGYIIVLVRLLLLLVTLLLTLHVACRLM